MKTTPNNQTMKPTDILLSSVNPETPTAMRLRTLMLLAFVVLAFWAAALMPMVFALHGSDGSFDPTALRAWIDAKPTWMRGAFVALMLACFIVEFELFGRIVAIPLGRVLFGGNATPRQAASLRLVVQVSAIALIAVLFAVKPEAFPHPIGWIRFAPLGIALLALGVSVADCARKR